MTNPNPHRVVIVGAGFGGLRVALELEKRNKRIGDCAITLIDAKPEHVYTPLLYEVCTGGLEFEIDSHIEKLRSGVSVPYESYVNILKSSHIKCVRGEVIDLDDESKTVILKNGERIEFDDLVIAVGAQSATFGIPGVEKYAFTMKTLSDGLLIRSRLFDFLEAYRKGEEKFISVVVGGAGATGTEFAAELANFFERIIHSKILRPDDFSITLVEAGDSVLGPFPDDVREKALTRLKLLGVTVKTNTFLNKVEKGKIELKDKDGNIEHQEADVVVWTAGIKPREVVRKMGLPVDDRGYVVVEPSLRVKGKNRYFAVGDCITFIHPKTKQRVPALAQAAIKQAGIVAENLVRHLEGKPMVAWSPPEKWKTIVPLGGKYAVADLGSFRIFGVLAYLFRKAADLKYFISILPFREAFQLWLKGAKVYIKND